MSKILQQREQLVYPPQIATSASLGASGTDNNAWSYVHSFSTRPFSNQDLDASNYKSMQTSSSGGQNILGQESFAQATGQVGQKQTMKQTGKHREAIDRFGSLIDAEAPRFAKQRRENNRAWESSVQGLCGAMHKGIDAYYDRRTEVHNDIVHSIVSRRDELWPQADISEITDEIRDLALAPWLFQSLPGTKPSTQWPNSLPALAERLDLMAPASLWNDPLDLICGGPEFFDQARDFIQSQATAILDHSTPYLLEDTSLALSCHFEVAVKTGNYQRIIEALDLQCELTSRLPQNALALIFEGMKPRAMRSVNQMIQVFEKRQSERLHHLQTSSVHGVISIAKYVSFVNLTEFHSSITIDGLNGYLYLWVSMAHRGNMYKIGTGEAGTLAGRVYLSVPVPDREGEVTWVFWQGKLWARRVNEGADIGHTLIYDPATFRFEGTAKLNLSSPPSNSDDIGINGSKAAKQAIMVNALNRYFPLLTDGTNLFAITINVVNKRRRVKDSMRKHYQQFKEDKKKKAEIVKPVLGPGSPRQSQPKDEKMSDTAKDSKALAQIVKDEARRKRREDRERSIKDMVAQGVKDLKNDERNMQEDKQIQERIAKEISRQKMKEKKELIKANEQRHQEMGGAPPGVDKKDQQQHQVELPNIEHYRVCEFYLHEFDMQFAGQTSKLTQAEVPSLPDLMANDMVCELFASFSGFFTHEECYQSLHRFNEDMGEAAAWLVDEGEKERGKKDINKVKTVLLCQSEIVSPLAPILLRQEELPPGGRKPQEIDIVVKEGSLLTPSNITSGKWTISAPMKTGETYTQYVSYHNLTLENGSIKVFSARIEDLKVINEPKEAAAQVVSEPDDEVELPDTQQEEIVEKSEVTQTTLDLSSLNEEDLYDNIKLQGTLVKIIKLQRTGPLADLANHNLYIIYDHCYSRYYLLQVGSTHRYIAVAEDLTEMYQLLKEHSWSAVETTQEQDVTSLSEFALKTLEQLSKIGNARFNMQWRWKPWSNNYQQAIQQIGIDNIDLISESCFEGGRTVIEQKKKQNNRLASRFDKVLAVEKLIERETQIGIPYDEKIKRKAAAAQPLIEKKKSKEQAIKEKVITVFSDNDHKFKQQAAPRKAGGRPPIDEQFDDGGWGEKNSGLFSSPPSMNQQNPYNSMHQYMSKKEGRKEIHEVPQTQIEAVLPVEKILVYREFNKLYAYCVTGNIETLQILINNLIRTRNAGNTKLYNAFLLQTLSWVLYAETLTLSNSNGITLLEKLFRHIMEGLETEVDRTIVDGLWRIMIIGWPILVRSTQQAFTVMSLILKHSTNNEVYSNKAHPLIIDSQDKTLETLPQERQLYYVKILQSELSPLELFHLRFFNYHASFYPLEVILQSRVTCNVVLVDKANFPECKSFSHYDTERIAGEPGQIKKLTARYGKFRSETDCFQNHRQSAEISIAECKEYFTKPAEIGTQINYSYFGVPLHIMMVSQFEIVEDLENFRGQQMLDLDKCRAIYTELEFYIDSSLTQPNDIHEAKLQQLYPIRMAHKESAIDLLSQFMLIIKQGLSENTNEIVFTAMKLFNELIRQSMSQLDWCRLQSCDVAVEYIEFVAEMLNLLSKKTNGFKTSPFKAEQIIWLGHIKELLNIVINETYMCTEYDSFTYLAKKSLEPYISIIENIKLFYSLSDQPLKDDSKTDCFLDCLINIGHEGTDFSHERLFETPHPYPKGDYVQKDLIHIPDAIGYTIETDKRCATEFSTDCLVIQSADHAFWVNDSFGTHIRLHGRPHQKLPNMLLGNKLTLEFRCYPHSGKKGGPPNRGGRGGYIGGSRGENNNQGEDLSMRWGYKLIIRPIYADPQYQLKSSPMLKAEQHKHIMRKVGNEMCISLLQLLNQVVFMASKLTRAVTSASIIIPEGGTEGPAVSYESISKFMPWHLFKGGVRTAIIDQLHSNPSLLDETYISQVSNEHGYLEMIKQLEAYQEKKPESLRKNQRKASISIEGEKCQYSEFQPNSDHWSVDIKSIMEDDFIKTVSKKIRELVPYSIPYQNERRRPNFKKEYQLEWARVEELLIIAMLYHSNCIFETRKWLLLDNTNDGASSQERIEDKLKLIGIQLNDVLAWMQSRLQGEQEFQIMITDIVEKSQKYITKIVEVKRKEAEETLKKKEQATEEQRIKNEEVKKVQEEDQKKKDLEVEEVARLLAIELAKKAPVISKDKSVNKNKRKNVVKMAITNVDILKKKKAKKMKKQGSVKPLQEEKAKVEINAVEEPMAKEQNKPIDKVLEVSQNEQKDIKQKIYMKVYEEFLQLYQGNQDKVKPLCQLLNLQFNSEDPNESLKAIFKRVKAKLKNLIDFDGDLPIRESLDIGELKLESPYKKISKEVKARLLFLLELKPSIDYHRKVIQVDPSAKRGTIQEEDTTSQKLIYNESSINGDENDSTEQFLLEPLSIQRSQSVQIQPSIYGISGVSQAVIAEQSKMKEDDIANWIDNYRKWRQWNRQHKLKGDFFDEDLTSPYCSPLYSVVAFAKQSNVPNPDSLRRVFINHQVKAAFRILGLKYQERLLQILWPTLYQRLIIGNISESLQESTFSHIETCGETLAKHINEAARNTVRSLMSFVIQSRNQINKLIYRRSMLIQQSQALLAAKGLDNTKQTQSPVGSQTQQSQAEKVIAQQKQSQQQKKQIKEDTLDQQILKILVQTLNDIRMLITDIFTREYVLESLKKNNDLVMENSSDSMTFESVKEFLNSIVELMLLFNTGTTPFLNKSSQEQTSKMQFAIAYCCKLIMNQFMTDKSMMRSSETHRLLQESLLDIVVEKLEKLCGLAKKKPQIIKDDQQVPQEEIKKSKSSIPGYKLNRISSQDEIVQLMQLLSEVIRISNDHQQHVQSIQLQGQAEQYFLSEGSDKVMRCASILAFMMHHVEVPAVMRQTIKCARLFFNLVDFRKLKLHKIEEEKSESKLTTNNEFLIETLRQIGAKISNTQTAPETKVNVTEEKLYVVYANINSSDEDFSFLLTALYHWETLYPTFTLDLPKDPSEIVVKSVKTTVIVVAPKVEEVEKQKVEIISVAGDDQIILAALKESDTHAAKLVLQSLQEMNDSNADNVDLKELISMQQRQQHFENSIRGGFRGGRGGRPQNGNQPRVPNERGPPMPHQQIERMKQSVLQTTSTISSSRPMDLIGKQQQPPFYHAYQQQVPTNVSIPTLNVGIGKLKTVFEEVIKKTQEDVKEEDSSEVQMRKLNEQNYNIRVRAHIDVASQLSGFLQQRYSAPMTEPLPYLKAIEFSNILQKGYKGQLEAIQINPFLKKESADIKLTDGKTVANHFPLILKTIELSSKNQELPPGHIAPIIITPKRLVVSLAETTLAEKYEQQVETKYQALRQLEKNPIEGFKCNIIPHSIRRQGASISVIIQDFITLLRSLISVPISVKKVEVNPDVSFQKTKAFLKVQQQQEIFSQEMISMVNGTIDKLASQNWKEFSQVDKQVAYGVLAVVGGWTSPITTGQKVQVEINNQWVDATIVDDGLGKKRVSVILDDDDTLTLQKIPCSNVRQNLKFDWPFDGPMSQMINQQRLCEAMINLYDQQDNEISSMLNERYLMMMLLKVSSQLKWYFMDRKNETFLRFMEILNKITNNLQSEEDKTRSYWEKALIDSWQRLLDKDEDKNHDFFVVKENLIAEIDSSKVEEVKEERKIVEHKLSQELKNQYQDNEFVQPLSSYLQGLPEPIPKKNSCEAALKLLAYWEKNIIPKIMEFVKTTYKAWEMNHYFEQLRHHLRTGDSQKAVDDAMTMCERKMPQNCIVPDDNYDWTCKMIDECIVDSWALAKFKPQRSQSNQHLSPSNSSGETSFPLLNKLINFGIEEIVVLIKAVDLRGNVVLAEYQDPDTMQVHSIWIPVSHMNDLHDPLPPRAVGYTISTLKRQFMYSVAKIEQIYARQTLIQFFNGFQRAISQNEQTVVFQLPNQQTQLQEIISWSVWEEFSSAPVTGWMKELNCSIPISDVSTKKQLPRDIVTGLQQQQKPVAIDTSSSFSNLQSLLQAASDQIAEEQLKYTSKSSQNAKRSSFQGAGNTLKLIKGLFEKTIMAINENEKPESLESEDVKLVSGIVDWCIMNWYNISERIRSDRAVFDLCQQYETYTSQSAGLKSSSSSFQLLPLHELISSQSGAPVGGAIGTLLMFKKSGAHLTPTSKIQFYSDANQVNLISEISAGSEGKKDLPPLLLNHSSIWVNFDAGTTALLPKYLQTDQKSCLPCAVVHIPNTWSVCCWLTETITNALLLNIENTTKFTIAIYEKLISALTTFYEEAKAPSMLKSIIFNLLSRLIVKLRHVYLQQLHSPDEERSLIKSHLKRLFISKDFLQTLLSELLVHKEAEELGLMYQANQQTSILYTAFVQDSVELILTMMMPTVKHVNIDSFNDLFSDQNFQVPEWLQPLIKALYFMQYFSGEMHQLSRDILRQIHQETMPSISQLDQIMVIQQIPISKLDEKGVPLYTKEIITAEIVLLLVKHGARIINPSMDIIFSPSNESVVLIIDGIDHIIFSKENEENEVLVENGDLSDTDDDWEDETSEVPKKEEVKVEEEMPQVYSCPSCTFINAVTISTCEVCGSPRPPMEVIIAEFQAANQPPQQEQSKMKMEGGEEIAVAKKTITQHKLDALALDMTRIISRLETKAAKQRKQEQLVKQVEEEKIISKVVEIKIDSVSEEVKALLALVDKAQKKQASDVHRLRRVSSSGSEGQHSVSYKDGGDGEGDSAEGSIDDFNEPHLVDSRNPSANNRRGDDQREYLISLGIEPSMIDQDPDLAQALAESMIAEQEIARLRDQEEEEKKLKEIELEAKRRKKEEQAKLASEQEASGTLPPKALKPKSTKLKVLIGQAQIFDDNDSSRLINKILRDRIQPKPDSTFISDTDEVQFSDKVINVLKEIHKSYHQNQPDSEINPLPSGSSLLEDFAITQSSIRESSLEEFIGKCAMLAVADVTQLVKLLESQGFDLQFQRAFHASYIIPEVSNKQITIQALEKLKAFVEIEICKDSKGIIALHPSTFRLLSKVGLVPTELPENEKPINYYDDSLIGANFPELYEPSVTQADIRYQWALLRVFNKYLAPTVPYINTSQSMSDLMPQNSIPMKLSTYMSSTRNLCLMNVKFDLRHLILEKTSVQRENAPKIYFERLKLAHRNRTFKEQSDEGEEDNIPADGAAIEPIRKDKQRQQDYMFVQAYDQIKDQDLAQLRPKKPQGAEPHCSFHIVFKGEHVVGEGGPYRQFFADISSELQPMLQDASGSKSRQLGLLCQSPNNRTGSNIGRGKYIISPSRISSNDLSLFEFLGILMGVCIRTGAHLNLDLPQFVWKQLSGQRVSHEDLIEIDLGFWKLLQYMLTISKSTFEESCFETWSIILSDQETLVELRENGKDAKVQYEDRASYVKQALYTRMTECKVQCEAIKRGISRIIPEALLNMVTYNELETWVCGKAIIDVDLLKRHTKYGGDKKTLLLTEESRRVIWFWEVLREFSEEDKQKFIKFCWGQQRLPANDEEFERRQTRFMIKPAMKTGHGDGALPKADTCFFNLELPDYSSKEIMKQRILLAIHTDCDSMNADPDRMGPIADGDRGRGRDDHEQLSYDEEY